MDSYPGSEAAYLDIYGIARSLLAREVVSTIPLALSGVSTMKYVSVPIKRPHTYESAHSAAQRFQDEGFAALIFYPEWESDILNLIVVWDKEIRGKNLVPMPCISCENRQPTLDRCSDCGALILWEMDNAIPGKVLRPLGAKAIPHSTGHVIFDGQKSLVDIPSADFMRRISEVSRVNDSFDVPILHRVLMRLNQWSVIPHVSMEPMISVQTSKFITVPLSIREMMDHDTLRKAIFVLETKGFICGPVTSERGRYVLLVCWDNLMRTIFPEFTPCSQDCGEERAMEDSCYCAKYDLWLKEWNQSTGKLSFVEQ